MPNINPKTIGDITYSQEPFWRVTTLPIKISVPVVKGKLMTIDAAGRLIAITGTTVTNGIFQPLADVVAPTAEDTDFVQVVTMGSRILQKAPSGVTVGNPVNITASHDKIIKGGRADLARLGTVFEIYTRDTNSTKKQVTADDDLVIIESGMF